MLQGTGDTNRRARALRRAMSLPEILLWRMLKVRPGGWKFRKQHPAGPYVADFYCHEARLVIEVDGEAHDRGDRPARDVARDAWFAERGIVTLRLTAATILTHPDDALTAILSATETLQ